MAVSSSRGISRLVSSSPGSVVATLAEEGERARVSPYTAGPLPLRPFAHPSAFTGAVFVLTSPCSDFRSVQYDNSVHNEK